MDTVQEVELIVGLEDTPVANPTLDLALVVKPWGAWSLVPTAGLSNARRKRIAAAARVRMNLKHGELASPIL